MIIEWARFSFCFTLNRVRCSHAVWLQIHLPNFFAILRISVTKYWKGSIHSCWSCLVGTAVQNWVMQQFIHSGFEKRMPRNLFWWGSNKIAERKFRNNWVRYLYSSPGILLWRRRLRWTGRVGTYGGEKCKQDFGGETWWRNETNWKDWA
jgi:hypothetical protein